MKKSILIFSCLFSVFNFQFAQVPHTFSYQAVIRNNAGEPLSYQLTNLRISLILGSAGGPVSYQETHLQTTNFFGLVNLEIGNGTVVTGVFDTLSWNAHSYYIKVEADGSGGSNFIALGTTQLLAVPYALHAEGATSAATATMIQDSDGETKVTTELTLDDNQIRFYTGGQERLRLTGTRLEVLNGQSNLFFGEGNGQSNTTGFANVFIGDTTGASNTEGSWNTFVGSWNGIFNTTGSYNTFIGTCSGGQNTTGEANTFVGTWSGTVNTGGMNNTFIGYMSGLKNTGGNENTFVGSQTGRNNAGGMQNTFIGHWSGFSTNEGMENTFVGNGAGWHNLAGSRNLYIGAGAGLYNQTGEGNVFIGTHAGVNEMGSNRLIISNREYDPLISGEFDNQILRFCARRIDIKNNNGNTILGDNAGVRTNGGGNVYIGLQTAILDSLGNCNVYIGLDAGYNNSTGSYNVFLGHRAGVSNTSGERNTFVGTDAGLYTTTGMHNTFIGIESGRGNVTGNDNTYLGMNAGFDNESGSQNVFIGSNAGRNETASNKLYISNSEISTPLIYGEFDNSLLKFHGQVNVVNHDLYINDASKGIILTSPGNQCYRVTVADDGTLVTSAIECP